MSFGSFQDGGHQAPMADINTTPLVDVMLVLLVIFIITAPLFNQAVPVDLPNVEAARLEEKTQAIEASLDASGVLSVNGERLDIKAFEEKCRSLSRESPDAELYLRADRGTRYERVTEILAASQAAGVLKVAFVTDPATER